MGTADEEISERLIRENDEFRKIHTAHKEYKKQIEEMSRKGHLNAEEELEMARVKKLKLAAKDKLEMALSRHR
ncbi:MAG: DUF465 domain-containing protein [Thermodesulfobacteriota bacterium]